MSINVKKVLEILEKSDVVKYVNEDDYIKDIVRKYSNQCEECLEDLGV